MKPFYDSLVNRMTEAGILLRPWDKITKNESLAVITPDNCDNYESAYNSMTQAIFNYLDQNKDTIFQNYSIPRGYIEGYRSTSDGFQVLYQTLEVNHPALVDLVDSKEDPVKPTMETFNNNIYTFCNALKDYFDYEYKGLHSRPMDHQRKVIKYIRAQLEPDTRYEKAIHHIDTQLKEIYANPNNPLLFPKSLTLEGTVAVTLMKKIPRSIYLDINNSISNNTTTTSASYQINKAFSGGNQNRYRNKHERNTRADRSQPSKHNSHQNDSRNLFEKLKEKHTASRKSIDELCPACGKWGHHIHKTGCDAMAQYQFLIKYNKDRNASTIGNASQVYKKFQQERSEKNKFAKDIEKYKHSIKTFQNEISGVDAATVKQLHLDSFREEIDPTAEDDIFDDISPSATAPFSTANTDDDNSDSSNDDDTSNDEMQE